MYTRIQTIAMWCIQVLLAYAVAWFIFFFTALFEIQQRRFDIIFLLLLLIIFFVPIERIFIFAAVLLFLWSQFTAIHFLLVLGIACFCYTIYYLLRFRSVSDQTFWAFLFLIIIETVVYSILLSIVHFFNAPSSLSLSVALSDLIRMTLLNSIFGGGCYVIIRSLTKTWSRAFLRHI